MCRDAQVQARTGVRLSRVATEWTPTSACEDPSLERVRFHKVLGGAIRAK